MPHLRAIGEFSHEGNVIGGPGLVGEASSGAGLHFSLLWQLQHGCGNERVIRVQDVVQRARKVLPNVCELQFKPSSAFACTAMTIVCSNLVGKMSVIILTPKVKRKRHMIIEAKSFRDSCCKRCSKSKQSCQGSGKEVTSCCMKNHLGFAGLAVHASLLTLHGRAAISAGSHGCICTGQRQLVMELG